MSIRVGALLTSSRRPPFHVPIFHVQAVNRVMAGHNSYRWTSGVLPRVELEAKERASLVDRGGV